MASEKEISENIPPLHAEHPETGSGQAPQGHIFSSILRKTAVFNLILASLGLTGCAIASWGVNTALLAFAGGFAVGLLNQRAYFKIAHKTFSMDADKAGALKGMRFYMRFLLSAMALVLITWKLNLAPWAVITGFTATLASTILAISLTLKKEFS